MGSKSPEGHQQGPRKHGSPDFKPAQVIPGSSFKGSSAADLASGSVGDEAGGDDEEEEGDDTAGLKDLAADTTVKKRKKPKKKRKAPQQTSPPRTPVSELFKLSYPTGQLSLYENTSRVTDEEARYTSRLFTEDCLSDYRQAAEIHRQVRQYAQKEVIKPGVAMSTIAEAIEEGIYALTGHPGRDTGDCLKAGPGFPTGLCLNNVAAHWTPNPGAKEVILQESDVLSVDFGVHVNGNIVDSAFTVTFDETYDPLLNAVKEATNTGIAYAGIDARMSEIGASIQELMESYEVEVKGKTLPVKAVRDLTGHNILPYRIHGEKQVPFVKNNSRQKMEKGDVFAIETLGSTGTGVMMDDVGVYGYSRNEGISASSVSSSSAKSLLKTIDGNFATIPFSRRFLERLGVEKYHFGMRHLVDAGVVEEYAPLVDRKGSMVAQFEHTILLHSGGKEVISRGDDY
ncbi:Methionine aminopeptidase 2-1 [Fulvia fulva]|uniref:Methionine aminopeptidase 2 n=1 Tax=Passalora fulva TaxID=5499 RepID=A0A9Q8LG32_PASFU|nr:Methionine aminopeptidase 2-1 [Fulvia fulva]KAK4615312.1 Methionine aminopeptidase 2-1 [Fulvia fulva]KAK4617111.1 Methionine aminopeptidase 2-1 [Fulvia fulva]UJO15983.1 Methionine aminopeptidase 2-1 [Fulvia fulva]WPV19206.1 Methionine aminopeptidase 2-1 [Fulvia fulva]WPV33958.1 Methionine aminopeptidase 2-1 [Fulvia fulva]